MRRTQNGFNLIELMIIVVIIGILAATSLPWLRGYISNSFLSTTSRDLYIDMVFTKESAQSYSRQFVICASTDSATCSGVNAWETGWIVYDDANANGSLDPGPAEPVTRIGAAISDPGVRLLGVGIGSQIAFSSQGWPQVSGNILVCDQRSSTEDVGRVVQLSPSGRVKIADLRAGIAGLSAADCPAP